MKKIMNRMYKSSVNMPVCVAIIHRESRATFPSVHALIQLPCLNPTIQKLHASHVSVDPNQDRSSIYLDKLNTFFIRACRGRDSQKVAMPYLRDCQLYAWRALSNERSPFFGIPMSAVIHIMKRLLFPFSCGKQSALEQAVGVG